MSSIVENGEKAFRRHMDNDFDTPKGLAALMALSANLARFTKRGQKVNDQSKQDAELRFRNMAAVFGVLA